MKINCIIQARTGSTRLPNKIQKKINGITILEHCINRVKKAKLCDNVIIATTTLDQDKPIVEIAKANNVLWFCGSENDLLDRYMQCCQTFKCDVIVRITSDCPLIDPILIDKMITTFIDYDSKTYLKNTWFENAYPSGYDIEIFPFATLKHYWETTDFGDPRREHVLGHFLKNNMHKYSCKEIKKSVNQFHLSVDTHEDYIRVKKILNKLGNDCTFQEVMQYMLLNN